MVVEFRNFNGQSVQPNDVKLKVYDTEQVLIETIIDIQTDNGRYYYDYIAPQHDFIFEFSGVVDNKPILARQLQKVKFI
ncbi:hypothetical protein MKZ17_10905 [Solibacillus sp. FSL R7-0682]|uniref:hypothetical protein n=1 Tax=Solibacillus sp. FSL R7-0682 TaxID=2921690 RepID=UPI0030F4F2CE